MLITPPSVQMQEHIDTRTGLEDHFNHLLEKILVENAKLDKYWILGKVKMEKLRGKKAIARPFLQACMEKPGLVKESFVYEVDNRRGVKTLLWVMHPGELLSFPTLGKSIRVSGGKKTGGIIMPPM